MRLRTVYANESITRASPPRGCKATGPEGGRYEAVVDEAVPERLEWHYVARAVGYRHVSLQDIALIAPHELVTYVSVFIDASNYFTLLSSFLLYSVDQGHAKMVKFTPSPSSRKAIPPGTSHTCIDFPDGRHGAPSVLSHIPFHEL